MIDALRDALRIAESLPVVQRCADCENFDERNGCLVFGEMPPAEFQTNNNCQDWDDIPF